MRVPTPTTTRQTCDDEASFDELSNTSSNAKMWSSSMNIRHLAKMLFAALIAFLIHPYQALASTPAYDQCVYALDQTAANALYINGAVIINAPSCGVVVDSSSSTALK